MKLFLIERDTENIDWDEYEGFLASAETPEEALSFHPTADEGASGWEASKLTIREIGTASPGIAAGLLFSAFHAG
jgi:hypothetical protein